MKVTIKGIVKENREDILVDKIVKSLLDDTEYRLYHRFMGEIVCELKYPMFKGLPRVYDRVDIVEFLNMFKNEKDSELTSFRSSIEWNNYLESNYGMSGEYNVSKIGIRYYNTLFTRILDEFENFHYTPDYGPVNESVENREDRLVDRVVESLLGDTTYEFIPTMERVMSEVKCPMYNYPIYFNESEIRSHLNDFKEKGVDVIFFNLYDYNYMDDNYSIKDETILEKIYLKYYTILFTNILNDFDNYERKPMNESVENKEDLLVDKISQFMLDDTEIIDEFIPTMERVIIFYPFYTIENFYSTDKVLPILLKRGYDIDFVNYVQNTYSIKDWNLIVNISQRYYSLLYDKVKEMLGSPNDPMNESVERKEDTLNKIVDFMISDTKWDVFMEHEEVEDDEDWTYVKVTMYWPGGDSEDYNLKDFEVVWEKFIMGNIDRMYLEQQFGITEEWVKQELYNRYISILRPIIYEEMKNYTE